MNTEDMREMLKATVRLEAEANRICAINAELLEVLQSIALWTDDSSIRNLARGAIAKAKLGRLS